MSSPPPGPGDLGAANQGELPVAEQESETRSNEDTDSSSDEGTDPGSPTAPGQDNHTPHGGSFASPPLFRHQSEASRQASCSSCQPICFGQCFQTGSQSLNINALFNAELAAMGEELERIRTILSFVEWISKSDFLRHQQREPMVGDLLEMDSFPKRLEAQGIRGLSTYTALFNHVDMQIFTCKICGHVVSGEPEDAITHQRAVHFGHYPYRCSQTQCPLRFANQATMVVHQNATGH